MRSTFRKVTRGSATVGSAASPQWRTELVARAIRSTNFVDRSYIRLFRFFERSREAVVLAIASEAVFERLGELGYSNFEWYRGGRSTHQSLFPWEAEAIERFFPRPPAAVLIGGAGTGREPANLAQMGYDVVAFEPVARFVEEMQQIHPNRGSIQAFRASYEDLPRLLSAPAPDRPPSLQQCHSFHAAILGWSSFSHIRSPEERLRTLQSISSVVNGPILLSFFSRADETQHPPTRLEALRRRLPGYNQDAGMRFAIYLGVFRTFTEAEMRRLVGEAGLVIDYAQIDDEYSPNAHVVIRRPDNQVSGPTPPNENKYRVAGT